MYMYHTSFLYVLYFISILHVIPKKNVWNFCFLNLFCSLVRNEKTWFLYVTSKKGFLEFSTAKTTKQNKEYV